MYITFHKNRKIGVKINVGITDRVYYLKEHDDTIHSDRYLSFGYERRLIN